MVTEIITRENSYHEAFRALQESQPNSPGLWLKRLRESAMESFQELGFPSVKDEEWKYTNVGPIARIEFKRSEEHTSELQSRLHLVCRLLLETKKQRFV